MANVETVVLASSACSTPPGSRRVRKTDPNPWMELTLGVRRRAPLPALSAWEEIPPSQRVPMSRADLAALHGSDPAAVAAIRAWAASQDLIVTRDDGVAARIGLGGTAASLGEAFGVELFDYQHDELGEFHARAKPVRLPAHLACDITGVFGFDNHAILRPSARRFGAARPWSPPSVLAEFYGCPAANVPGRTIGMLEFGGAEQTSDVKAYFSRLGLARPVVQVVAGEGAPDAAARPKLVIYFSTFDEKGLIDSLSTVIGDAENDPSVLSINWGEREFLASRRAWSPAVVEHIAESFLAAAHLGISLCASAGEAGPAAEAKAARGAAGSLWTSLIARLTLMLYMEPMIDGDTTQLLAAFR